MWKREQWRSFFDHPVVEWTLFFVGLLLLFVVAPLVGAIPGPGGVIVAGIGLALVLRTSLWAKRRYVHFKRWQPKVYLLRFERWRPKIVSRRVTPGRWTDWALRRRSPKRREALRKEQEAAEQLVEQPVETRTGDSRIN
ncbi:MAG TPA: hypothetical protein VFO32_02675 [Sphingomicrobium sp.]|jgi:hypothetical protein|nr:hypothetical protein [Sphingomicrobium sp.]